MQSTKAIYGEGDAITVRIWNESDHTVFANRCSLLSLFHVEAARYDTPPICSLLPQPPDLTIPRHAIVEISFGANSGSRSGTYRADALFFAEGGRRRSSVSWVSSNMFTVQ